MGEEEATMELVLGIMVEVAMGAGVLDMMVEVVTGTHSLVKLFKGMKLIGDCPRSLLVINEYATSRSIILDSRALNFGICALIIVSLVSVTTSITEILK